MKYCDYCQRKRIECDRSDDNCEGKLEREYEKDVYEYETSPDFVEGRIY